MKKKKQKNSNGCFGGAKSNLKVDPDRDYTMPELLDLANSGNEWAQKTYNEYVSEVEKNQTYEQCSICKDDIDILLEAFGGPEGYLCKKCFYKSLKGEV